MTRAIRKYSRDFIALIALAAIGLGISGYILTNQRLRFPVIEDKPLRIKAEFSDAQAVIPGQGQTVRVAGVRIGDIGKVELKNGRALVTMEIDKKYERLVHPDATALLRPKTGLKDMFIELDPGRKGKPLEEGDVIPVQNTAPDVDPDEIFSALDTDTRAYLRLLINGLGKGLDGAGDDLQEVFKRFLPLHRDLARLNGAIAARRTNLARLVSNYGALVNELGKHPQDLTRLVNASNAVFEAFASQDANISLALSRFPSALRQTEDTLVKVDAFGRVLGPSLESLRPAFRQLDVANREVLPFAREATPLLRDRIRPFVRTARPYIRDLQPAARDLARATPDLVTSFGELNRFFNMLAFNPHGRRRHTDTRDAGYLFWLAWVAQTGNSVFSTADGTGVFRRVLAQVTCASVQLLAQEATGGEATLRGVFGFPATGPLCPTVSGNEGSGRVLPPLPEIPPDGDLGEEGKPQQGQGREQPAIPAVPGLPPVPGLPAIPTTPQAPAAPRVEPDQAPKTPPTPTTPRELPEPGAAAANVGGGR